MVEYFLFLEHQMVQEVVEQMLLVEMLVHLLQQVQVELGKLQQ